MGTEHEHGQDGHQGGKGRWSPGATALAMVGVIAAFYLIREHWTHLSGWWSYVFLLACPLMHLFHGHGGHGGHDAHHGNNPAAPTGAPHKKVTP